MPFSPILSAFVWLTLASTVVFSIVVLRHPTLRQVIHTVLARPLMQAILMIVLVGMTSALLSAIPIERQGETTTLLQATVEATGAGHSEARASAPFATHDEAGEPLAYAGHKLKAGSSKAVHITKYSLVAAIAGGVTSFTCILFTAAFLGVRRRKSLAEGIQMLSSFYWRPAMLTGVVIWMITTWLLLLWPNWHVLGTTASGADLMAVLLGLSPWVTCIGFWIIVMNTWLTHKRIASV